jgi:cysteine desulfurase/selenocysteine lyase
LVPGEAALQSEELGYVTAVGIDGLRSEFPVTSEYCYLDASAYGPTPTSYMQRVAAGLARLVEQPIDETTSRDESVRGLAARLIHGDPERISLVPSTGYGISLVTMGITWSAGDEVVVYEREYPPAVAPWLMLRDKGVRLEVIQDRGRDGFSIDDVAELLSPRTRAICISYVNWENGFRAPIEQLRSVCEGRDVWIVCDAIQAMGVLPLDAEVLGVDVLAAQGFKYLLAGYGCGIAALSQRATDDLRPAHVGYRALQDPDNASLVTESRFAFREDVRRFEMSTLSLPAVFGMEASLDLLLRAGTAAIGTHVLRLAGRLANGLSELGYEVARFDPSYEHQSHVVVAGHRDSALDTIQAQLLQRRVVCSFRRGRLRFGLHLYNNDQDIDYTLAQLAELSPR